MIILAIAVNVKRVFSMCIDVIRVISDYLVHFIDDIELKRKKNSC